MSVAFFNILPKGKPKLFIFDVKTDNAGTSGSNQFTMPISGTASPIKVDWGDGNKQTITTATTHTYATAGTYEIQVENCNNFRFNNGGDKLKMLEVKQVEGLIIGVFTGTFYGCTNMTWTATDAPSIVGTNLQATFQACSNFNANINNWNVSGVTNFANMFRECSIFNQPLNLWDTSSATSMFSMFLSATNFNGDITTWNTSLVTSMGSMIRNCDVFNQDLSGWCVELIASQPAGFSTACPAWVLPKPNWGAPC